MTTDVLGPLALNRATLERQLLLRRSDRTVLDAVDHLVGLQAQVPQNPYLALWSRLDRFEPDDLGQLLLDRKVVRIVVMRGTIHLVTADDALAPATARAAGARRRAGPPRRVTRAARAPSTSGLSLAFARPLLAERPLTGPRAARRAGRRFPDLDAAALAYACRNRLALRPGAAPGLWGSAGQVTLRHRGGLAGASAGRAAVDRRGVLRYLARSGRPSVADAATGRG